jgi:hypothetical protein
MKQAADVLKLEKETAEKLAAKAFAKSYLQDLVPSVFNNLRENGYFYDPVNRDLELGFMPWILKQTLSELELLSVGRLLLDNLLKDVVNKREADYRNMQNLIKQKQDETPSSQNDSNQEATQSNEAEMSEENVAVESNPEAKPEENVTVASEEQQPPETSNQPEEVFQLEFFFS